MEAGLPPDRIARPSDDGEQTRASKKALQNFNPARRPPPVPAAFKSLDDSAAKASVISKPSPAPQWPLREGNEDTRRDKVSSPENMTSSRGPVPQRPARPGNIPSLLDSSKIRDYTPSMPYRQQDPSPSFQQPQPRQQNGQPPRQVLLSPDSLTDSTDSGSVGSIPDFPLPATQTVPPPPPPALAGPPSRRNPSLGPPPAIRRGPSSYYSRTSFVSPIPEEFPEKFPRNAGSYASSKVIPSSWGSAPPGADGVPKSSSDEDSLGDEDEKAGDTLVRQASLGKRGKPSLRTINKVQNDQGVNGNTNSVSNEKPSAKNERTAPIGTAVSVDEKVANPAYKGNNKPQLAPRYSDEYTSSESSDDDLEKPPIPIMRFEGTPPKSNAKKMEDFGDANQRRRPPRINIDAVREAEARGSLTSLPDLIRRATKLASNLDRGKTASRLGIMDMLRGNDEFRGRNSGSLSDILASFPPPGVATPTGGDRWPGPFSGGSQSRANPNVNFPDHHREMEKRGRRCCGMPLWAFLLVCALVIILIVAAVLIPVFLIVLPQQNEAAQASSVPASQACETTDPCMNGGVSVGTAGSCGCVCVNGFGGDRCSVAGDRSCGTMNLASDPSSNVRNATMGNALPRLFEDSQANFSIPLNASKLLRLFNDENMSCTSQNALITFNGASRKRNARAFQLPDVLLEDTSSPTASRSSIRSRENDKHLLGRRPQDDSNTPTRTTSTPTPTRTSTASGRAIPTKLLDFSRIAVLFIFEQTEDMESAVSVHDSIQSYLEDPTGRSGGKMNMDSMGVAQNVTIDFIGFSIRLDNGTVVGGK
ncbi:hypothetical protein FQN55_000144 [Onygenales sp. PD_40]|nr:hypothetical protein FQN55_000144 [Onygenales sp. PD_40]